METVERRLDEAGTTERLRPVLEEALAKKSDAKVTAAIADSAGAVDELALEESKAYRAKMGKWSVDVLQVTEDVLFARIVAMMTLARGPILHLSAFLKKKTADGA